MEIRSLGKTGLKVTSLCLGTMKFGNIELSDLLNTFRMYQMEYVILNNGGVTKWNMQY